MSFGEQHRNLARALPVSDSGTVVDLGCGSGATLRALRERHGAELGLVGVDREMPKLDERLASDPNVQTVAADLDRPLPFADASFDAAVCHNTLECLPDKGAFLDEVARVLRPGGHLLLGHTDFDTIVFNAGDIDLTRRLVHANADTQEAWMDASDGTIGRRLVAIARRSPLELVDAMAWVILDTSFADGGAGHSAARSIAAAVRRDRHDELAARLDAWIEDLLALAARGEFLFSINDYAVLLRKPAR
jgi:SAM-dependent methyltransferase